MFWTPIAAIMLALRGTASVADNLYEKRIRDQNLNFERIYDSFMHRVRDESLQRKMKAEIRNDDFWRLLGAEPTAEEERLFRKAPWFRINEATLTLAMSEHGKLPVTQSLGGIVFRDHDPVLRSLAERYLLKSEDNLRRNGVHTTLCLKQYVDSYHSNWYTLSDFVKIYGFGKTAYADEFLWAQNDTRTLRFL